MLLPDIKKAMFNNLKDYWKTLAKYSTGEVVETAALVQISTSIASPLFNPFFLTESANELPYTLFNATHSFWHDSERNKKIIPDSTQLESIMEHVPMMVISLDQARQVTLPEGMHIEQINDYHDLSTWIHPVKIAFSMADTMAAAYQRCFELAGPQFIHFVVKKGDTAVASASLYLHEEMAGFYNISVLPEFRKLGLGTALHNTRMNVAKEKGYTYATLQATPMAAHLGANLGFQTHSEVNIYQRRR